MSGCLVSLPSTKITEHSFTSPSNCIRSQCATSLLSVGLATGVLIWTISVSNIFPLRDGASAHKIVHTDLPCGQMAARLLDMFP